MFAGLASHNTGNGVPMVRSGDEYGIDIFAVEDFAKITVAVGLAVKPPHRQIHEGLINVRHRGDLAARVLHEQTSNSYLPRPPRPIWPTRMRSLAPFALPRNGPAAHRKSACLDEVSTFHKFSSNRETSHTSFPNEVLETLQEGHCNPVSCRSQCRVKVVARAPRPPWGERLAPARGKIQDRFCATLRKSLLKKQEIMAWHCRSTTPHRSTSYCVAEL